MSKDKVEQARLRRVGRTLVDLLQTPEERLDGFVERRLGELSGVSIERVASVRALALLLADTLEDGDAESWTRVDRAWEHVSGKDEAPALAKEAPAPEARETTEAKVPAAEQVERVDASALPPLPAIPRDAPSILRRDHHPSPWVPGAPGVVTPPLTPPAPLNAAPVPGPLSAERAVEPSPASVDETAAMMPALKDDEVLPFSGQAAAPPPVAQEAAWHVAHGQTEDVSSLLRGMTLPYSKASLPMTIEQYAAMVAKCEAEPMRRTAIQREHGVETEAERRTVDAQFAVHFERDEELAAKYEKLLTDFRAWIARTRGSTP